MEKYKFIWYAIGTLVKFRKGIIQLVQITNLGVEIGRCTWGISAEVTSRYRTHSLHLLSQELPVPSRRQDHCLCQIVSPPHCPISWSFPSFAFLFLVWLFILFLILCLCQFFLFFFFLFIFICEFVSSSSVRFFLSGTLLISYRETSKL